MITKIDELRLIVRKSVQLWKKLIFENPGKRELSRMVRIARGLLRRLRTLRGGSA